MPTMSTLSCRHGKETSRTLQFSGMGKHEIRIARTSSMAEHVEGIVSLKSSFSGEKLFKHAYRSDKGGFRHVVNLRDEDTYELKVTGSAHSFTSGLFGCAPSHMIITVKEAAVTRHLRSQLSFSLMETSDSLAAEYNQAGIQEAQTRSQEDLSDCIQRINSAHLRLEGQGAADQPCDEYIFNFVAAGMQELVELLEQHFKIAGIAHVQSGRMLITDAAGAVVNDWPESEEGFPLRIRYTRETPIKAQELKSLEHGQLVQDLQTSQGLDLVAMQAKAPQLLRTVGLRTHDMGARNVDERGNCMYNQCFYLSLARGLLGHSAPQRQIQEVALRLKRNIEAAVIAERPHWKKEVGEEAQAFADFLPVAMRARNGDNFLAELAVCIVDSTSGHVEAYLGPHSGIVDVQSQQRNLIVLWYMPGHYKCVVNDDRQGSKVMMTYKDFRQLLVSQNVGIIETFE